MVSSGDPTFDCDYCVADRGGLGKGSCSVGIRMGEEDIVRE